MSSYNKCTLFGNLGADAELRSFNNGNTVLNFSIATTESWKDKDTGEKKEKTEWHRCALYGKRGESIAQYLTKGTKVLVEGKIEYRSAEKDGVKTYFTDIKVLDVQFGGGSNGNGGGGGKREGSSPPAPGSSGDFGGGGGNDDDIPF